MNSLEQKAKQIRRKILETVYKTKHGHIGGSLSCVDILVALYYKILKDEKFILSKGHASLALYVILDDLGKLKLKDFCKDGGLAGHPEKSDLMIESGSLGHGLGIAAGMALSGQKVIVLIGDGELYEGSTWEAISFIGHHKLDVILIVDRNGQIVCDFTEDINKLEPLNDKFISFGWEVHRIDGHDFKSIVHPFGVHFKKPLCIIADTVKGKGVSFMESSIKWHHSIPTKEEYELALGELG